MAGKQLPQALMGDLTDPFNAGQLVGMLVMLKFIEQNKGIPELVLDQLMGTAATNLQPYFERPTEDIHLIVDNLLKEIR